jgi:hypothetical protein
MFFSGAGVGKKNRYKNQKKKIINVNKTRTIEE